MVDALEAQIRGEMERVRHEFERVFGDEWGDEWYHGFFTNFHTHLPGGGYTRMDPETLNKRLYVNHPSASERRRNQTEYEFLEECRTAVLEAGLTSEQVIEAIKRGRVNDMKGFYEMLFPVYVILRRRGYKHYPDLTA